MSSPFDMRAARRYRSKPATEFMTKSFLGGAAIVLGGTAF